MENVGQWSTLQSQCIVKMYGVTLCKQISMVSEFLKLGPLDVYLREHKALVKEADLIEAAFHLTSALWHLV